MPLLFFHLEPNFRSKLGMIEYWANKANPGGYTFISRRNSMNPRLVFNLKSGIVSDKNSLPIWWGHISW